jgi:hypothetical protein
MFSLSLNRTVGIAVIAISCVALVNISQPVQASPRTPLYIDSSGKGIPMVFWDLRSNRRFAKQLAISGSEAAGQIYGKESIPHLQDLVYRESCPKRNVRPASLFQTTCYGQYMVPEYRNCTLGCGGHSYVIYFSTGTFECYGYSIGPDACNGCDIQELHRDPCS